MACMVQFWDATFKSYRARSRSWKQRWIRVRCVIGKIYMHSNQIRLLDKQRVANASLRLGLYTALGSVGLWPDFYLLKHINCFLLTRDLCKGCVCVCVNGCCAFGQQNLLVWPRCRCVVGFALLCLVRCHLSSIWNEIKHQNPQLHCLLNEGKIARNQSR